MAYSAYVISDESRARILERLPPSFPEVIAHHITYRFPDKEAPPQVMEVRVIGHAKNQDLGIECLVVSLDGVSLRPTGGIYHITLSLDRSLGAKPVHSNRILKSPWIELDTPFLINVEPLLIGP